MPTPRAVELGGELLRYCIRFSGDRKVGHLTTTARHHELGPIALALVKRSIPADADLVTDGTAAAQELVVAV